MKRITILLFILGAAHICFAQGKAKADYNQLAPASNITTALPAKSSPVKTVVSVNQVQPSAGQQNPADTIPFNKLPRRQPKAAKAVNYNELAK